MWVSCSHMHTGALHTVPPYANMLGGTSVQVSGPCFNESDEILCDFGSAAEETPGVYLNKRQAVCISPMLSRTGDVRLKLRVLSKDGHVLYESNYVPFYSCELV